MGYKRKGDKFNNKWSNKRKLSKYDNDYDNNDLNNTIRHAGSIPIDEIKSSSDYNRKIIQNGPKRKYAICFGYLGSAYQGLQINPNALTVEAFLEKALFLSGAITEHNFGFMQKVQWTRSARTDRGVHAIGQCCSMKLIIPLDENEKLQFIEQLNSFLPNDIRVFGLNKVPKGFNSHSLCGKRRYQYLLPTYMLQEFTIVKEILQTFSEKKLETKATYQQVYQDLNKFRLSKQELEKFRNILKNFEGTKTFHNFTTGKTSSDANAIRYIISFTCEEPIIFKNNDGHESEWLLISILGQSFLLNQIRKMIGLAIEIAVGSATETNLNVSFSKAKIDIPMAPATGLYLDELFFDGYNMKCEKIQNKDMKTCTSGDINDNNNDDKVDDDDDDEDNNNNPDNNKKTETIVPSEKLLWSSDKQIAPLIDSFRKNTIWPHIIKESEENVTFIEYLDEQRKHPHYYKERVYNNMTDDNNKVEDDTIEDYDNEE